MKLKGNEWLHVFGVMCATFVAGLASQLLPGVSVADATLYAFAGTPIIGLGAFFAININNKAKAWKGEHNPPAGLVLDLIQAFLATGICVIVGVIFSNPIVRIPAFVLAVLVVVIGVGTALSSYFTPPKDK